MFSAGSSSDGGGVGRTEVDAKEGMSEWLSRRLNHVLSLTPLPLLFPKPVRSWSKVARAPPSSVRLSVRDTSISCLTFLICASNDSETDSVTSVLILFCTLVTSMVEVVSRNLAL